MTRRGCKCAVASCGHCRIWHRPACVWCSCKWFM